MLMIGIFHLHAVKRAATLGTSWQSIFIKLLFRRLIGTSWQEPNLAGISAKASWPSVENLLARAFA
jgi:hypothetical protein